MFNELRRIGSALLVASISAAASPLFASQAASPAAGSGPLTLRVACEGQGAMASLRVRVANQSSSDTAFLLGFTPATNAGTHVVSAVTVLAIRPATGADEEFLYVNPKFAAFTGRSDPWLVSLASGATYDMELPLRDFISRMNYTALEPAVAGGSRLVIDARPVAKQPRAWVGKVQAVIEPCG